MKITLPIQYFLFSVVAEHNNPAVLKYIADVLCDHYFVPDEITEAMLIDFAASKAACNNATECEWVKTTLITWYKKYYRTNRHGPM
jgi:hypothetical protein